MTDKLRAAIAQAVAILGPEVPLCSGCIDEWREALRILNAALAEMPAEQEPRDARYALAMLVDPEKLEPWQLELYDKAMTAPQPAKREPDDEGLFTETQVQQLRESFEQSITDPENQPSQYGTVPLDWHLRDEALLRQALEALDPPEHLRFGGTGKLKAAAIAAIKERLE